MDGLHHRTGHQVRLFQVPDVGLVELAQRRAVQQQPDSRALSARAHDQNFNQIWSNTAKSSGAVNVTPWWHFKPC
jgi:hypothetical protein